jgi:hypothetical protein
MGDKSPKNKEKKRKKTKKVVTASKHSEPQVELPEAQR